MKHLVFTGPPNSGKTTLIGNLARQFSEQAEYSIIEYNSIFPDVEHDGAYHLPDGRDFYILLQNNGKYVLFFSWGDIPSAIDKLAKLLSQLAEIGMSPYLVIMSSRDASDWLYNHTEQMLGLNQHNKIEIPLGRMVRGNRRNQAVEWYLNSIMELVNNNVLANLLNR